MSTFAATGPEPRSHLERTPPRVLSSSVTYVLLGLAILLFDLLTSPHLFPLVLFVVPVVLSAWFCRGPITYALSLLLPIGSLSIVVLIEHTTPPHYAVLNALMVGGALIFLASATRLVHQNFELKRRVRVLETILPMCMGCKSIRDEHQTWKPLEVYVTEHTDSVISHGLCPDCAKRLYGEFVDPASDDRKRSV